MYMCIFMQHIIHLHISMYRPDQSAGKLCIFLAAMKIGHLHSIKTDLVFISVQPLLMNASVCCSSWHLFV